VVEVRETVPAMLKEYEGLLPLQNSFVGSILKSLSSEVIPTINLANYDGPFGNLISIDEGTRALVAIAASETHTYTFAAVPSERLHVYRALDVRTLAAAGRTVVSNIQNAGISGLFIQVSQNQQVNNSSQNLLNRVAQVQAAAAGLASTPGDLILFPGDVLTVIFSGILITETSRVSFKREVYTTPLSVANRTADCTVVAS